jgi:glycosyltransferase involved in cell wall biosynthesis
VNSQPLVSCIMPTYNRRAFVPRAIEYFLRQDYLTKELITVNDGMDPVKDLMPIDDRIHYVHLSTKTPIGAKRNLACEQARAEIIAHDDDAWHVPHWRRYQVETFLRAEADV